MSEVEETRYCSALILLVLPSMIRSFGGVILEAWAYAVPVLASISRYFAASLMTN
jgi:glycosyltransferase involved in cell wall biosynthesis